MGANVMMESRSERTYSVLLFPWLAHGHITPFLELGKKLSQRNFNVHLCSTPVNLNSINPEQLLVAQGNPIHLVEHHLPSLPDLPPHYHTTKNLPPHLMSTLKEALDKSAPSFCKIMENLKPDLLIYDFLLMWTAGVASSMEVPAVGFLCFPASVGSSMIHLKMMLDGGGGDGDGEKEKFRYPGPDHVMRELEKVLRATPDGPELVDKMLAGFETSKDILLVKSFRRLEGEYIEYLENNVSKRIVPVGPLVPETTYGDGDHQQVEMISQWLDKKEKGSTVFVSFGSECFLSKEEREEVAYGLELSGVNFIWPIRFPAGEKVKIEEALPEEYLERVPPERGLILEDWAPQMMILKHPNVGGFVSHCGWNSTLESMKLGVPIVAMPMHLDQPINAEVIESVGVGIKVRRNQSSGGLDRKEIARTIREVVVEESGESVRRKAKEMSEHMEGEGEEEIDEVVQELVKICDARTSN